MSLTDLRYRVLVVVRAQGGSFADHGQKHHSIGTVDIVVIVSYVDVVVVVVILVVVVVVIVVVRVGVGAEESGQGDGGCEEVEEGEG